MICTPFRSVVVQKYSYLLVINRMTWLKHRLSQLGLRRRGADYTPLSVVKSAIQVWKMLVMLIVNDQCWGNSEACETIVVIYIYKSMSAG